MFLFLLLLLLLLLFFFCYRCCGQWNRHPAVKKKSEKKNAIWRAKDALGKRIQRELSLFMMWVNCLSSPSASVGLQHGGFVKRQCPDSKNLHLYLMGTNVGCVHKLLNSWGYNFLSPKDISRKILTRTIVFNYDNLWLDCFHGYWSRDFYWLFGECNIFVYKYIYIYMCVCTFKLITSMHSSSPS